jgi:hypothetical protein
MAEKAYESVTGYIEHKNWLFARKGLEALARQYAGTPAAERAKAEDLGGRIAAGEKREQDKRDAYNRLTRKYENYVRMDRPDLALQKMESDPDYTMYKDDPKFREYREKLRRLVENM